MDQKGIKFDQSRRVYIQLSNLESPIVIMADQIESGISSSLFLRKDGVLVGTFSAQWLMGWWTEPQASGQDAGNPIPIKVSSAGMRQ